MFSAAEHSFNTLFQTVPFLVFFFPGLFKCVFVSHFLLKGSAGGNDEHAVVLRQRWRYWWLVPLWFHRIRRWRPAHLCAASSAHVSSQAELKQGFSFRLVRHTVSWLVLRNTGFNHKASLLNTSFMSPLTWSDLINIFSNPPKNTENIKM